MRRVSVVGNTGAGKTTLARALARELDAPLLELDSIYHQAGWEPLPLADFRTRVGNFAAGDTWVIDGNYSRVIDLVWAQADTVVWVDPPRWKTAFRLSRRTFARVVTRRELWNGNRESLRDMLSRDPERSVLRWSWRQHHVLRARYEAAMANPANARLSFHRVRSAADAAGLLPRQGVGTR